LLRKDGEVTFLRSSQGSVGILQINERVWRGFYEVEPLRWNIGYNARAGSEILERYRQLALRSVPGRTGDDLARAIYALYNGGPGQLRRYLSGKAGPRLRRVIDGLFGEKMRTAPEDVPREVARCLVGG
jgi:soluble lytic murein transglycosylase-like protein